MAAVEDTDLVRSHRLGWKTIAGIALVSAFYFADIFLKASRKCFWLDELFTTYLCRLPNFKSTWVAVLNGADFNPPLLYLFTRSTQWLFGEGLIASRLPAMLGVWLFGVCLFLFVSKRAGVVPGFIAGIFPFFTLAQYYAYEARPHGIILGWCGLLLVCWQKSMEGGARKLWLAGFGFCLAGALLTHVYAVFLLFPFGLVELYNLWKGRPNLGIIGALVLAPVLVTLAVYLPLFRNYRNANIPASFFPASHDLFQRFLVGAIGPATGVLLLALILFAVEGRWPTQRASAFAAIPQQEMLLAAGFALIPLLGVIGCKVSHGPFFDRYFLSSIAGYAMFLGFACSRREAESRAATALAGCMFLLMVADLGSTAYLAMKDRIMLLEPSTGLALTTTPSDPLRMYDTLSVDPGGLDIMVLPSLQYIFLFRYATPAVVAHLYYGAPENDINMGGYVRLAQWAHINLKPTTFGPFLATHNKFLVYGSGSNPSVKAFQAIAAAGFTMKSARADVAGILYEYEK